MMFANQLGLVPDWQYDSNPLVNININPHLPIPADWSMGQRTVQPIGLVTNKAAGDPLGGLGVTMASWMTPRADLKGVETWAWDNRKWLVIGGLGLLGLAALSAAGAILR